MSLLANSNAIESGGYNIDRSLRFRSSASAYLNRAISTTSSMTTYTLSAWVKRGALSSNVYLIDASVTGSDTGVLFLSSGAINFFHYTTGFITNLQTTAVYRDPSAWYHIVVVYDSTNATASNRARIYVNGQQVTAFSTATYPAQNTPNDINYAAAAHVIGKAKAAAEYFDGYLAEVNFIDGQALTPSSFGQTDPVTGVWTPKKYTGTYGTNGFYLDFKDNTSATTLAYDKSGNGNNWTANNISTTAGATYDSMTDVPTLTSATTANYCVLNPLVTSVSGGTAPQPSNGNLDVTYTATGNWQRHKASMAMPTSGKFYWETTIQQIIGAQNPKNFLFGIASGDLETYPTSDGAASSYLSFWIDATSPKTVIGYNRAGGTAYGSVPTTGDVVMTAVDVDNNKIWWGINGTWFNSGNPASGTNPGLTSQMSSSVSYVPAVSAYCYAGQTPLIVNANFGQRPFSYTPPTGFKALNTFNLPDPTIKKPNQYMDATTYTGNGATLSVVNAGGFQPDLVWYKQRNTARDNGLEDSVRGTSKILISNATNAEVSASGITAFNSNGFSIGNNVIGNESGGSYVGWQWKESATAGFDIVTYTGNNNAAGSYQFVNHSLGVTPAMVIVKSRSAAGNWPVYHKSISGYNLLLNTTAAQYTVNDVTGNSATQILVANNTNYLNNNGTTYVAYCFAEIAGFSKFGSYTGNGSSDGPFVYCGFRPKYVLIKSSSAAGTWTVWDSSRSTYNSTNLTLAPNNANAESSVINIDFTSNGFKVRHVGDINVSSVTSIFCAFAENPLKYSLAR